MEIRRGLKVLPLLAALLLVAPSVQAFQPEQPLAITVQACSWFSWECWMYPFVFFTVFLIEFMLIGALGGAGSKALTYLMLVSFAYSSLVIVMMGMLPITAPLLATTMLAVYAWRMK